MPINAWGALEIYKLLKSKRTVGFLVEMVMTIRRGLLFSLLFLFLGMVQFACGGGGSGGGGNNQENLAAPIIAYSPAYAFTVGTAMLTVTPTHTGGAVASWIISPDLPAGLLFSPNTGEITGTPRAATDAIPYVVTATNTAGQGNANLSIKVGAALGAPIDFASLPSDGQVELTWAASANATSYRVKRANDAGGPYAQIGAPLTSTHYLDTGLTNGRIYYYVVSAIYSSGEIADSSEVSATPSVTSATSGISLVHSRISGVAPLSVFFDLTTSPKFSDGSYIDATCLWNFDVDNNDPNGKFERTNGFVAAHVFEAIGNYKVRVDIYDKQGAKTTKEVTISATPFSGTTYYVAANGSDSNPGSIDQPVLTASHAIKDLAQPNTRILFKKGDTFHSRWIDAGAKLGPVIIGSYGSGAAPIIYSDAVKDATHAGDASTIDIGSDWRIMDLVVCAGGSTAGYTDVNTPGYTYGKPDITVPSYPSGVNFGGVSARNSLIYRVEQYHLGTAGMNITGQFNTVAECVFHNSSDGGYSSPNGEGFNDGNAVIGNWMYDNDPNKPEHDFRLQGGSRLFFAHNNLDHPCVNYDAITIRGNSDRVVIYKNIINGLLSIYSQRRGVNNSENQHYIVVESNLFLGRTSYNPPFINYNDKLAIELEAKDITIRNNIFYNYQCQLTIGSSPISGNSDRIKVYNNTAITNTGTAYSDFVLLDNICSEIDIKNNFYMDSSKSNTRGSVFLQIAPVEGRIFTVASDYNLFYGSEWVNTTKLLYSLPSEFTTLGAWQTETGNDTHSSMQNPSLINLTDPGVALAHTGITTPWIADVNSNFARPAAGSPLINSGAKVPVFADYFGNLRDSSPDIGAVEYQR